MVKPKKIGISLPPDLYQWALEEVEAGRAESVSALVAAALEALRGQSELEALVRDLEKETGELDDETLARIEEAERAADEAWHSHLHGKKRSGETA